MPARVAKQLNELGKVRVQTEGFRDASDVVMGQSVVICTRLAMQRHEVLTAGNFGNFGRRRIQRCGSKPLFQRHNLPLTLYCGGQRAILAVISNHSSGRSGPSRCRQDERQYNQRGQQHARYK